MDDVIQSMFDRLRNEEVWWKSTLRWVISVLVLALTARIYVEGLYWLDENLQIHPFFYLTLATLLFVGLIYLMIAAFTFIDKFGRGK